MSTEKAEALVVRLADFSESSRVVTFFSREFGKFSALAKGAKRLKGPFDTAIDLLSRSRIVFIRKSSASLDLLTEARLVTRFRPSGAGLTSLYGGYYVADLLCGLTEDEDPSPELFDLATRTLEELTSESHDVTATLICFEITLLRLIGLLANLSRCGVCGQPLSPEGQFAHWVGQGSLLCEGCRKQEYAGRSISAGSVAVLRAIASADPPLTGRIRFTRQQAAECHQFAVSAITNALGRKPATLRYIDI